MQHISPEYISKYINIMAAFVKKLLHSTMTGFPPHPTIFFNPVPWGTPPPPLNNRAPPCKKQHPPLKHEAPFQEKIPRKNTKNKNSKSSKYFKNMCEEVLFSKSAGLQDYSWQLS